MGQAAGPLTRGELEAMIIRRCWRDPVFRRDFLRDPRAAFQTYLGVPPAMLPTLVVHEEAVGTWHIVLPPPPPNADELSDAELERLAGGVSAAACHAQGAEAGPRGRGGRATRPGEGG